MGRRLSRSGASIAAGVDLVPEMLGAADERLVCAAADVGALPFDAGSFDVVWCRLVLGHVRDIAASYRELARVCARGGTVIVSDLHTDAVAAGHRRTFHDAAGATHELEHFAHSLERHRECAVGAALALEAHRVGVVGPAIERFYVDARREKAYAAQQGLPLVSVMSWRNASRTT